MKTYLVTGCSSGLGYQFAQETLAKGHRLICLVRQLDQFKTSDSYRELSQSPLCRFIEWDLQDSITPDFKRKLLSICADIDQIDLIFHFAGYLEGGPLEDLAQDQLIQQFNVNFFNIHEITRICFRYLQSGSQVLVAGSVAGHFNYPFMGPYCSSKHAIRSLFECWYHETYSQGIRFQHLSYGPIQTPFWVKSRDNNPSGSTLYQEPLNRLKEMSLFIEKRGLTTSQALSKTWKIIESSHHQFDHIIVKNYLIDYMLPKIVPTKLLHWVTRKTLKL